MDNDATTRLYTVPSAKLWFGLTASACAWVALGIGDVLITWWACLFEESFGAAGARSGIGLLYFAATFLLLALAVTSGITSYRNWRKLSGAIRLRDAEGRGRQEFMALMGVFVSFTLGVGILWLTVPLVILKLCVRAR